MFWVVVLTNEVGFYQYWDANLREWRVTANWATQYLSKYEAEAAALALACERPDRIGRLEVESLT